MPHLLTTWQILAKLISFNTVSHLSNLPLIDWLEEHLTSLGGKPHRIYSPCNTKANLVVRFGNIGDNGLIISGHTDVVPTDEQVWHSDPFTLTEVDGHLIGRGSCDMKGALACAIAAIQNLYQDNLLNTLKQPIYLVFSYDEEIGCIGARTIVDYFTDNQLDIAQAVIIEPTNLKPLLAHKGINTVQTLIKGKPCHSSQVNRGVSAVMVAGKLLHWINSKAVELAQLTCTEKFDPPYSTIHSGLIKGGTAVNIMAENCKLYFDYRPIPGIDASLLLSEYQAYAKEIEQQEQRISSSVKITVNIRASVPSHSADETALQLVNDLLNCQPQNNSTHYVSFATEAGLFQRGKIPSVVCGPGNPLQAHQPNEYISIQALQQGEAFLTQLYLQKVSK